MAAAMCFCAPTMLRVTPARAQSTPRAAVSVEAMKGVLDAFRSHNLVALGEGQHWNEQGHAFRLALLRHPSFITTVDDVVVEFGNSLYQPLMDRFTRGEEVSEDSIRLVWRNTTQPNAVWDMAIYEEFFRAVRTLNVARPGGRQLRVLLADPPIDWNAVRGKDDILGWMAKRDSFAADLVEREVVSRGRRALLIFGDGHLWRKDQQPNLVSLLEGERSAKMFVIGTPTSADLAAYQRDVASWPAPSITMIRGTTLGATEFAPLYELTGDHWRSVRVEDQFDALLYLGAKSSITLARFPRALCDDATYMQMRTGRMGLVPWGRGEIAWLKRQCEPAPAPARDLSTVVAAAGHQPITVLVLRRADGRRSVLAVLDRARDRGRRSHDTRRVGAPAMSQPGSSPQAHDPGVQKR